MPIVLSDGDFQLVRDYLDNKRRIYTDDVRARRLLHLMVDRYEQIVRAEKNPLMNMLDTYLPRPRGCRWP